MIARFLFSLCLLAGVNSRQSQPVADTDPTLIALFPQQNDIRNTLNLSGMWRFKKDSLAVGEQQNWQQGLTEARIIAIPGSWNEQFTDSRDYLGSIRSYSYSD